MHQLAISLRHIWNLAGITAPLFCGSCLLQRKGNHLRFRRQAHTWLKQQFRVVYEADPESFANAQKWKTWLGLLDAPNKLEYARIGERLAAKRNLPVFVLRVSHR